MSCATTTGATMAAGDPLAAQFLAFNAALPPAADLPAWLALVCDRPEPLVYVGPGAGRRALALAAAGRQLLAVEADPALADLLAAKLADAPATVRGRITLVRGRVEDVAVTASAQALLAPSLLLNYAVTEPACQQAFLRACRRWLAPGGVLALELYNPYLLMTEGVSQLLPGPAGPNTTASAEWLSTTIYRAAVDPWVQRCAGYRLLCERFVPGGPVSRYVIPTTAVVAVFPRELALLLEATGFRLDGIHALTADLRPPRATDVSVVARATAC
jgi:hypothetical protein